MGWLGDKFKAYQNFKNGRNPDGSSKISEEDLIKYTGHDKTSLEKWAATAPGVGGGQKAGALTAGGTSGLYNGEYSTFDVGKEAKR